MAQIKAKVNNRNRIEGIIKTSQGDFDFRIAKLYKGAPVFTLTIDGEKKGIQDYLIEDVYSKLFEYTAFWK